jgi:Tryptophan halogenase
VKALKREVYEEIVGGGPAGSTAGTLLANRDADIAVFEKEKFPRFTIGESLPPAVRGDYVLSSYEADVVKPLMHFSSIVAAGAGRSCRSKSKAKIPRGSGLTKKPTNNTPSRLTPEELFFILYRMILFAESNSHIASLE